MSGGENLNEEINFLISSKDSHLSKFIFEVHLMNNFKNRESKKLDLIKK